MKKLIKFAIFVALVAVIIFAVRSAILSFREWKPDINEREWRLITTSYTHGGDELEYPKVHGAEGIGGENSKLVDVTLTAEDGIIYIRQGGEVVAKSNIIDKERDENNNYVKDKIYLASFDGCECRLVIGVTEFRDWHTELTGFDGNLYGKYMLSLEVLGSESNYTILFFAD